MNTHIMLDLETMGTASDAAIIAIGAVKFNPRGNGILDAFYTRIDLASSIAAGLTVTGSTVDWWMHEDRDDARTRLLANEPMPLWEGLAGFTDWYETDKGDIPAPIWGNGALFDNAIMRSAYDKLKMKCPWSFREDRCYRTMKASAGVSMPFFDGIPHFALDDARMQAQHLQAICNVLEIDP